MSLAAKEQINDAIINNKLESLTVLIAGYDESTLDLSNKDIGDDAAKAISKGLRYNEHINSVNLSNNDIGDKGSNKLFESIISNNKISELNISNNNITNNGIEVLEESIPKNKSLKKLNLSGNRLGNEDLEFFTEELRFNKTLKELDLSDNELEKKDIIGILDAFNPSAIETNKSLEKIGLRGAHINEQTKESLKDLENRSANLKVSIEDNQLGNEPVTQEQIKEAIGQDKLKDVTKLVRRYEGESLDLSNLGINDDTAKAVFNGLIENTTLRELNLENNNISDLGASNLVKRIEDNDNLEKLNLNKNNIGEYGAGRLAILLKGNESLKELGVKSNGIGDSGVSLLSQALKKNKKLEKINLADNGITDYGLHYIDEMLHKKNSLNDNDPLNSINLSNNDIKGENALELRYLVSNIDELDISGNKISDAGAKGIITAIERSNKPQKLDISNNNISEKEISNIRSITEKNPQLNVTIGEQRAKSLDTQDINTNSEPDKLKLDGPQFQSSERQVLGKYTDKFAQSNNQQSL